MIQNGTIVNEDISASAAIATSKLAANSVTINGQSIALGATALVTPSQNYVINGGFDIWQRGFSIAASAGQPYSADRWEAYRSGFASGLTVTRELSGVAGILYCARVRRDLGNASTATIVFDQSFETINSIPLRNKTVTLSFYLRKGPNFSGSTIAATIDSGTGTDQSFRVGYPGLTSEALFINPTEFWTRYKITRTIPANASQVGMRFQHDSTGTAGSNDWYEITGVQLEEGSVETSFRRHAPSVAGELAACQRYYFHNYPDGLFPGGNVQAAFFDLISITLTARMAPGGTVGTNRSRSQLYSFPVQMRSAPSVSFFDFVGNASRYTSGDINGTPIANNHSLDAFGGIAPNSKTLGLQTVAAASTHHYCGIMFTASSEL
jgi:hypothetical protein